MVNSVVLVLGASLDEKGKASQAMRRRTRTGCGLAQKLDADILLSGGFTRGQGVPSEAEIMAELAQEYGMEPSRIVCEKRSCSTLENLIFAKKIIEKKHWNQIYVVSDRLHLIRVRLVCRRIGLSVHSVPASTDKREIIRLARSILYEFPALIWYGYRLAKGHHRDLMNKRHPE